ncbi:MAG: hypothetical protein K5768_07370 [Firmicutes bacterium]|nr:hypothetical protein [Bacillota bacterium]
MTRKTGILTHVVLFGCLIIMVCSMLFFSLTVKADTGPHPSVIVYFENLSENICYATLLSEESSIGPFHSYRGTEDSRLSFVDDYEWYETPADFEIDIWQAFIDYQDTDGFHFLQYWINLKKSERIEWKYWAPNRFKILLYYPESNNYVVSGIIERYAYDSYFTVNMAETELTLSSNKGHSVTYLSSIEKTYPYPWGKEMISLFARICITIVLEAAVALIFRLYQKRTLLIVVLANIVTQVLLNVALNVYVFWSNTYKFIAFYLLIEVGVFLAEAILYSLSINKYAGLSHTTWFYFAYAFVANATSFLIGLVFAYVFPGAFWSVVE